MLFALNSVWCIVYGVYGCEFFAGGKKSLKVFSRRWKNLKRGKKIHHTFAVFQCRVINHTLNHTLFFYLFFIFSLAYMVTILLYYSYSVCSV